VEQGTVVTITTHERPSIEIYVGYMTERDFSGVVLWPRNLWDLRFRHRTQCATRIFVLRHIAQSLGNSDASIPESGYFSVLC
jgi:hypothetical protein